MFLAGQWLNRIAEMRGSYASLENLISDHETVEFYVNSLELVEIGERLEQDTDVLEEIAADIQQQITDNSLERLRQHKLLDIQAANEAYMRQMVVLIVSLVESLMSDFLGQLFMASPNRMYDYLNDDSLGVARGKVDLKDVIGAETKDELILRLATRSAALATRGRFGTAMTNLERVANSRISPDLSRALQSLVEQRNRIVHEVSEESVCQEQVTDAFETITHFLGELSEIAGRNHVGVDAPFLFSS